jgi:hypothetical protein
MGTMHSSTALARELVAPPVTMRDEPALDRLVGLVKSRKDKPFTSADDFNKFELELGQRLREVGREILRDELAKADVDAECILIDGVEHRRVLRATETYMTTEGPVTAMRSLYRDYSDPAAKTVAALEARVGIVGGFWTAAAAKQATWVVSQMTPALSEELFARVGTMHPSKSSLDRLPKEISARWEPDRKHFEAALREVTTIPTNARSIAVSIDGVLAPMKDGDAVKTRVRAAEEGRISKGPAGYREIGCATVSFCDEDGEMISAIRIARMPEHKKATLKTTLLAEVRSIWEQRPDLRVIKVADAAANNWDFLGKAIPVGEELIDFWHAAEHLGQAIAAAYGDGTLKTRHRFAELRDTLLEVADGVERVIRSLDYLRREHPRSKVIGNALQYFRRHRKRMRYAAMREQGLPVGSGPVEAACKTLVAQRMKQSGMRWGGEGGQAILTTRGWTQSERFDHAWALVAATYQVEVTTLDNVIPLRPLRNRP